MDKVKFSPSSLLNIRGFLHMAEILLGLLTFIGAGVAPKAHTFWYYSMIIWALCFLLTLVITIIELFLIHKLILFLCMDWDDFTTGIAFMAALTTTTCALCYCIFYVCLKCLWDWLVAVLAILVAVLYVLELVKDKLDSTRSVKYLAALPGIFKILEAYVSCLIFVSVMGYQTEAALIFCLVAYIIPFPIIPVVIAVNVFKKLRDCLPFNLTRVEFLILVLSVLLYILAAILWPVYTLRNNPRPDDCPAGGCAWSFYFLVTLFTYVNLGLFTVDLVFTLLGICGFKRS
ncbi:myeloid-associated differentiation marker-like protein 2 [Engraulis encrasicolus]|uniref:myeloid-associated differentiation marker-like protein 2 n=1 Tax=Engraulis encrasicolus TaxID=184585 RepID=UPI002FD0F753